MPKPIVASEQIKSLPFAFAFNNFYVELSRIVTVAFHNDLHLWLVLAAVTNNSIARVMNDPAAQVKYRSPAVPIEEEFQTIKLLPLSEIVGLPRTTVRRKVEKLVALGYVERIEKRGYRIVKGKLATSRLVNAVLIEQHNLLERVVRSMIERDMLDISGVGRSKIARP